MYAKTIRIGFATRFTLSAVLLLTMASIATAQSYSYLWDNGGGNSNWGTGTNWGLNPPLNLGFNNVTPSAFYEEQGLINNGNTVNVTTSQTQFNGTAADNAVATAGVTVNGVTAVGNGSTLNIASGGTLSVLVTYGPNGAPPSATPTAGTGNATLLNRGTITVQPGGTLTVKNNINITSGTLTVGGVAAGGQVTAGSLLQSATNGAVNLLGSGTLNLTNGGAVLNGITTIVGPNVVFNTPGINMANTTVFSPDITSAAVAAGTGHSVINVSGGVSVNGTIRPLFHNGVVPQLGDTWTLWDSALVQGNFTASDSTGAGAALPTGLRYALKTTTVGSVHGVKGQLTVENFLTAEVNRANGQVTIRNTNTTVGPGVTITGYQIGSAGGALKPSAFTPAFGGGAWESVALTGNSITQLNPSSSSVVGLGASNSIGSVYDPVALQTRFGTTPVSDLTFSYSRSDGRTVNAPVTYINTGLANTLVLQVDPNDGKARIINDSVFNNVQIDGYQVTSASSSLLTTWNSLQDQSVTGWEEAAPTTSSLAELNPSATTTVNAGQTAATMMGLFKSAGGTQDLQFTFRVAPNAGDYNSDGNIDAADYTVWRDTLGSTSDLRANGNDSGASADKVDAADYLVWKSNFGKINGPGLAVGGVLTGVVRYLSFSGSGSEAGTSAVPEPSSLVLLALSAFATAIVRRRM